MSEIKKRKIIEILTTACISAGLAFLQNLIAGLTHQYELQSNPAVASAIGGAIHTAKTMRYYI